MKLILLIAFFLIFSIASSKVIKMQKNLARTIAPEALALELEFFGSCQEFETRVVPSIWISRHAGCLPIQFNITLNPDDDNLLTHYFCTPVGHGRSVIHFVEIYASADAENTPHANFVVSLIPSNPFRVLTDKTSLQRRPDCFITHDYCSTTNAVVNSCRSNGITFREHSDDEHRDGHRDGDRDGHRDGHDGHRGGDRDGHRDHDDDKKRGDRDGHRGGDRDNHRHRRTRKYIVNHDRIYITAASQVSLDCKTSGTNPLCCAYIAPLDFGGICDHNGSNDLLDFPRRRHHDNDHHDNHHDDHHDNHHDNHDNDWNHGDVQGSWDGHHDHDKKEVKKQQ